MDSFARRSGVFAGMRNNRPSQHNERHSHHLHCARDLASYPECNRHGGIRCRSNQVRFGRGHSDHTNYRRRRRQPQHSQRRSFHHPAVLSHHQWPAEHCCDLASEPDHGGKHHHRDDFNQRSLQRAALHLEQHHSTQWRSRDRASDRCFHRESGEFRVRDSHDHRTRQEPRGCSDRTRHFWQQRAGLQYHGQRNHLLRRYPGIPGG